jgi:hypothetical protein
MHPDPDIMFQQFALSHGQVRWVLGELGLRVGDSEAQFDAWLKYVRRMGVPFYPDELGRGAGVNVTYRFHHVMELAVALALRTQGILPLHLLRLLVEERKALRPLYYEAYRQRDRGLGAKVTVRFDDDDANPSFVGGAFLDLHLDYRHGGVLTGGNPQLLSAREAVLRFMRPGNLMYPRPPLPLSRIAFDIVRLADGAPELRRGRH